MEWQTIDTAPKDGTIVLLYTASGDYDIGHHEEGWPAWLNESEFIQIEPIYWMPLPPPPNA